MSNIVQFPQRNKGRIRKSTGPRSEGISAMVQFGARPKNVEHIRRSEFGCVDVTHLIAFALDTIIMKLPKETRQEVLRSALIKAAWDDDPERRLVAAVYSGAFAN
jgi:hypothetical protein